MCDECESAEQYEAASLEQQLFWSMASELGYAVIDLPWLRVAFDMHARAS